MKHTLCILVGTLFFNTAFAGFSFHFAIPKFKPTSPRKAAESRAKDYNEMMKTIIFNKDMGGITK